MFSGIIEEAGTVVTAQRSADGNVRLDIKCSFVNELHPDQSVAHNGVCLTVVEIDSQAGTYSVTAIEETLRRSNLGLLRPGDSVNLERSIRLDSRLDGHIVQGHVDTTAECSEIEEIEGSRYYKFVYNVEPELMKKGYITVEKGSIAVNGVSLTVCDSTAVSFRVAIIPYTLEHTNFKDIKVGSSVNLEFDIIGKYVAKLKETDS